MADRDLNAQILKGLQEAAEGATKDLGDFTKYLPVGVTVERHGDGDDSWEIFIEHPCSVIELAGSYFNGATRQEGIDALQKLIDEATEAREALIRKKEFPG